MDEDDSLSSHSDDSLPSNEAQPLSKQSSGVSTDDNYSVERVVGRQEPKFRLITGDDMVFLAMLQPSKVSDEALLALMG